MRAKVNIKSNFSKSIVERVFDESIFMLQTNETLSIAAKRFGVSITTVWRDMRKRLPLINPEYYKKMDELINSHKGISEEKAIDNQGDIDDDFEERSEGIEKFGGRPLKGSD